MLVRVFLLAIILLLPQTAFSQRIVSALSDLEVSIDANFVGEKLTLFGNVEPAIGEAGIALEGPFDVVLVIEGPPATHIVREKTQQLGIWLNSDGATFSDAPGFHHILSSRQLDDIADEETLRSARVFLEDHIRERETLSPEQLVYLNELERLMEQQDLFGFSATGVQFLSNTFYRAQLELPANVPNGAFLAKSYLFSKGELLDYKATWFFVRTIGLERFIERSARVYPWLYGIACVLLALFTGWLGSVAFRR